MLNMERIENLAKIVKRLKYKPISFDNPELFPEPDDYIYPNYVFFMVAIDHRTGFNKKWKYHGSDLLFYLARKKQIENPKFFTAENLVDINSAELRRVFTFRGVTVSRVEERAFLLRDCAKRLLKYYEGDVMNLFQKADFTVKFILNRLREFRAYEDPLMKKSYLLIKILKRQGLKLKDPHNLSFPVDNVLVRLALSSGIINPGEKLMKKINSGIMLTEKETETLRKMTEGALVILSKKSGIEPDILGDILWTYGREIDSDEVSTPIDDRVDRNALQDFITFIRSRFVRKIKFPPTWYF